MPPSQPPQDAQPPACRFPGPTDGSLASMQNTSGIARGITCELSTCPIRCAAAVPASTAAFTAATSPSNRTITSPPRT